MFHPHNCDETLARYAQTLGGFIIAMIRSSMTKSTAKYKLPVTSEQSTLSLTLKNQLNTEKLDAALKTLHSLFMSCLQTDRAVLSQDKWACPLASYLGISSMRNDGGWISNKDFTPRLAMWTYCLRSAVLVDMVLHQADFNNDLLE